MGLLNSAALIFWDFDGVIKDSVEVKAEAFAKLFQPFGSRIVERIRKHHHANGGMSRFDKLPLYIRWSGNEPTAAKINQFERQFGELVMQDVIESPWVDGVEDFLRRNSYNQTFVLVSATPQAEMDEILDSLALTNCFKSVFGAPTHKADAISMTLEEQMLNPSDCLMIGDARADLAAAEANKVPFVLRKHQTNSAVFADYAGHWIKDFKAL